MMKCHNQSEKDFRSGAMYRVSAASQALALTRYIAPLRNGEVVKFIRDNPSSQLLSFATERGEVFIEVPFDVGVVLRQMLV